MSLPPPPPPPPLDPVWIPPLKQDNPNDPNNPGDVYFDLVGEGIETTRYNVFSLTYGTTFTLIPGTFTIPNGVAPRDTDVPTELLNVRSTLIGVIPLVNITSNHTRTPITISFPTNNAAISIVTFSKEYYIIPQPSSDPFNTSVGVYTRPGATEVRLPYRNALVINGILDASGIFSYGQDRALFRMEIKQAAYQASGIGEDINSYNLKKILVPITLLKSSSSLTLKPFVGEGKYTIPNSDANGIITREYLDGFIDLTITDFATTTRKKVTDGTPDYNDIIYYISRGPGGDRDFIFTTSTDTLTNKVTIVNNRILFHKVTVDADGTVSPISIKFLQEETPIYNRSTQRIGESVGSTTTIRLSIIKSTPTFVGQSPAVNTGLATTIYRLADMNKMTTEGSFVLTPPASNNTDPEATFLFSSSNDSLVKIRVTGSTGTTSTTVYTAFIYGSGTATITVTQPATTNFHQKIAIFDVNVFEITPAVINCNTNLFYTNPYNREFWTRFKPECRSSNLVDARTGRALTATEVDEVYDMRRKAEILKYNKNVGGLTKNQKYAKASRGELMRKIGNENKYLSESSGGVGGPFTLTCPTTPANRAVLCGLTSACGVPGKERLLCLDPSVNLYNYKKTYEYKAGLQVTLNIPTTVLTEPTNLRITEYDNSNNRITLVWDAPDSNGGFPITGYVITYSVDNKTWAPYKSVFPYKPPAGVTAEFNKISGEINGNSVVFERIPGSVEIRANTVYYISVFSGNVRGLSSIPATITIKTSSVPSIISDFGFYTPADERQNLMVDLKWTDPVNTGGVVGTYNGPPVRQYNLYYRRVDASANVNASASATAIGAASWTKQTLDLSSVIVGGNAGGTTLARRYILRNLVNENKYQIKIEPINSVGIGPESAIITARTLMRPGAPMNVILTAKYGLLPPAITTTPGNYINVAWTKPDTGGSPIKLYNVTILPPPVPPSTTSTALTIPFNVTATNTDMSYTMDIGRLGQSALIDGSYSIIIEAYNGYLTGPSSTRGFLTVRPVTARALIFSMDGFYTSSGLQHTDMTFTINTPWVESNKITTVKVNGLNSAFQTTLNIFGQVINGTGEHKIRIPVSSLGRDIIVVGTTYTVTITLVFENGEPTTSEPFTYTPEIKYL